MRNIVVAAREAWVMWVGLFALGIGFGLLVTSLGLPWWLAPLTSAVMFAGSAEFIVVGMLAGGAPIAAVAGTTFLVNARHLFYGLSFPLHRVRGRVRKTYSIYALCDEAYAFAAGKDPETLSSGRLVATQAGLHVSWATGALLGGVAGTAMLAEIDGLGFILTALFIVLSIDAFRADPDRTTALLAFASCGVALALAPGAMLVIALATFTVALGTRHKLAGALTR